MLTIKNKIFLLLLPLLFSCSAQQTTLNSKIVMSPSVEANYTLQESVTIKASKAAPTKLKANTTWSKVGDIEKGEVFKTKDQVVIVNSFNVHEGYIVINGSSVVGYYLPVQETFVEAKPVKVTLTKMEKINEK